MKTFQSWESFRELYAVNDPEVVEATKHLCSESIWIRVLGVAKLFSRTDPGHNVNMLLTAIDGQARKLVGFDYIKHAKQLFRKLATYFDELDGSKALSSALAPILDTKTKRGSGAIGATCTRDELFGVCDECLAILRREGASLPLKRAACFLGLVAFTGCRPSSVMTVRLKPEGLILAPVDVPAYRRGNLGSVTPKTLHSFASGRDWIEITLFSKKSNKDYDAVIPYRLLDAIRTYMPANSDGYQSIEAHARRLLCKLTKRDDMTFRALRHGIASLMGELGYTKRAIARQLGHETIASQNYYRHDAPANDDREYIDDLRAALGDNDDLELTVEDDVDELK